MWNQIKEWFEFSSKNGWYLPAAFDSSREEPSTTLLSFYLGLFLSTISLIAYHFFPDKLTGPTSMTLLFLGMTFIFYRLRSLDKVKFDLDDKSFELEDTPDEISKKD